MKQMMEKAGNSHLLTTLSYPGAGHLIELPYSPHIRASNFIVAGTKQKCNLTLVVCVVCLCPCYYQRQFDSILFAVLGMC